MTRRIPVISLEDFEAKAKKPTMMKSLVSNIAEGIEDRLESVNIAEIKNHDLIISVPKTEWKSGLENAGFKMSRCQMPEAMFATDADWETVLNVTRSAK